MTNQNQTTLIDPASQPKAMPLSGVDVSVILVSFNTRQMTLDAIGSLYDSIQNPALRIQVIVVDNNSHDGSPEAIRKTYPEVNLIQLEHNLGFGAGNNRGARIALGQVLFLLNTDTLVKPGAVQALLQAMQSHTDCGIVGPYLQNPDGTYQISMMSHPTVWRTFCTWSGLKRMFPRTRFFADMLMTHADPNQSQQVDVVTGAALMIRRDLYESLSGFDPLFPFYCEECDLCRRAQARGYQTWYVPEARVMHYGGASTRAMSWWGHRQLRHARTDYARRYGGPLAAFLTSAIIHAGYIGRIVIFGVAGIFSGKMRGAAREIMESYTRKGSPLTIQNGVDS